MAARVYAEQRTGQPFEVSSMPTTTVGVVRMSIRRSRGNALFNAEVEAQSFQKIRWTGEQLTIAECVQVHYGFTENPSDAQMGFVFEFNEGGTDRSLMVPAKDIAWMMLDPDVQEALHRR